MSFAVVKFMNENYDGDLVSEVPSSWLVKDNTYCKWPPEKFVSIYITKGFPPQDDWLEYAVEVECFCDTLIEAKEKASGKCVGKVGRGFRKIKPTDYFSPAEEEEKTKTRRRELTTKKFTDNTSEHHHIQFMELLNGEVSDANKQNGDKINETFGSQSDISSIQVENTVERNQKNLLETRMKAYDDMDGIVFPEIDESTSTSLSGSDTNKTDTIVAATVVPENDILNISIKLDKVLALLSQFKIDIQDIQERIGEGALVKHKEITDIFTAVNFPMTNLNGLEDLERQIILAEIKTDFIRYLKSIGGNDYKDFTLRILRHLFTNSLAELCSWTGRKSNYPIGCKKFVQIIFETVHYKTKCTSKNFEAVVQEWLRHAKQRRMREQKEIQ